MDQLWDVAGVCFDTDDGSLPGIEIANLSPAGVSAVYAMLRRRSRLSGNPPEFCSRIRDETVSADSVPNPAGLVAGGVELPVLGVFVWQDCVEWDYRMGREWGVHLGRLAHAPAPV